MFVFLGWMIRVYYTLWLRMKTYQWLRAIYRITTIIFYLITRGVYYKMMDHLPWLLLLLIAEQRVIITNMNSVTLSFNQIKT